MTTASLNRKSLVMVKSFTLACLFLLALVAFSGCGSAASTPGADAAHERPSDGIPRQYRAVCIDKDKHPAVNGEYVLTAWLDSRKEAEGIARYHTEWKAKGHRMRIDVRVKPERRQGLLQSH